MSEGDFNVLPVGILLRGVVAERAGGEGSASCRGRGAERGVASARGERDYREDSFWIDGREGRGEGVRVFRAGFRDLVKKSWVAIIDELKLSGGMPVPELQRRLGGSYMGIKDQCDALVKAGYLETWRVPRTTVGRPEIMYRLTNKADALFPEAGTRLTMDLLAAARRLFGDTAAERLLLDYFHQLREQWRPRLGKARSLVEKATLLTALREKEGCFGRCKYDPAKGFRIEEFHQPLAPVFETYPNAVQYELRMMEQLLGAKVTRREVPGGRGGPARIVYEVTTLGVREAERKTP